MHWRLHALLIENSICLGHSGIGLETARLLARMGAHVVISGRDPEKGKAALASLGDSGSIVNITSVATARG